MTAYLPDSQYEELPIPKPLSDFVINSDNDDGYILEHIDVVPNT